MMLHFSIVANLIKPAGYIFFPALEQETNPDDREEETFARLKSSEDLNLKRINKLLGKKSKQNNTGRKKNEKSTTGIFSPCQRKGWGRNPFSSCS